MHQQAVTCLHRNCEPTIQFHKTARVDPEFADRTVEQFIFLETERNVIVESERDIRDVLSQSQIGDMSSISRVAASCFRVIDAMYPPPSAAVPLALREKILVDQALVVRV